MFKSVNKVIKVMVFSDLVLLFSGGLFAPIFAVFIIESIKGGDAEVAGIAAGIFWLGKSIIQIPLARLLDKTKGENDDYYALIIGLIIGRLAILSFIFATLPWHIYLIQGACALAAALVVPSWSAIFTRHIEKKKEAFCWSLDSSAVGIGTGAAGILGGIIAKSFGFFPLFVGSAVLGIVSVIFLLPIRKELSPKGRVFPMPRAD